MADDIVGLPDALGDAMMEVASPAITKRDLDATMQEFMLKITEKICVDSDRLLLIHCSNLHTKMHQYVSEIKTEIKDTKDACLEETKNVVVEMKIACNSAGPLAKNANSRPASARAEALRNDWCREASEEPLMLSARAGERREIAMKPSPRHWLARSGSSGSTPQATNGGYMALPPAQEADEVLREGTYRSENEGSKDSHREKEERQERIKARRSRLRHNDAFVAEGSEMLVKKRKADGLEGIVNSRGFERITGMAIFANAISMGLITNMLCDSHGETPILDFSPLQSVFCLFFVGEWLMRVMVQRMDYFLWRVGNGTSSTQLSSACRLSSES